MLAGVWQPPSCFRNSPALAMCWWCLIATQLFQKQTSPGYMLLVCDSHPVIQKQCSPGYWCWCLIATQLFQKQSSPGYLLPCYCFRNSAALAIVESVWKQCYCFQNNAALAMCCWCLIATNLFQKQCSPGYVLLVCDSHLVVSETV